MPQIKTLTDILLEENERLRQENAQLKHTLNQVAEDFAENSAVLLAASNDIKELIQ